MTANEFNNLRNKVAQRYYDAGRYAAANRVFNWFPSRWEIG